ncbi:hypothetical protein L596_009081 [Steinernema carpocapsae]|uniref:Uncharacterized protein n=1 Tax=Steinernema carpocapsae TaxID=34508 RepID=A0A4U5PEQ4_STECR|nr:hypothetical protein L596_009081 [Steinernema carpocapsae]
MASQSLLLGFILLATIFAFSFAGEIEGYGAWSYLPGYWGLPKGYGHGYPGYGHVFGAGYPGSNGASVAKLWGPGYGYGYGYGLPAYGYGHRYGNGYGHENGY